MLYGPKTGAGWGAATSLQGTASTANVLYSGWTFATNFRDTTADGTAFRAADVIAPALTDAILNSGQVQVYFNFGGGVYVLPYTNYSGGILNTVSYFPRPGKFIITRFTADNSNSLGLSIFIMYRYIIIPGGQSVSSLNNRQQLQVDLSNYEAVRKYYRLKD